MRLILTFLLSMALIVTTQAQDRVQNIRVRPLEPGQIEILYDLMVARPGDSIYLEVRSRLRGALRIMPEHVRGDIGTRVTVGTDRRIVWNAVANGYPLNEEIRASVQIKTNVFPSVTQSSPAPRPETVSPNPVQPTPPTDVAVTEPTEPSRKRKRAKPVVVIADTTRPRPESPVSSPQIDQEVSVRQPRLRYVGPLWGAVSAVAPGVGNMFVQLPKPRVGFRPLLTVASYGLVAYGLIERQKSRDAYKIYEDQKNVTAAEPYYQTANDHYHRYYLATRGAMIIAAADVILTVLRGVRNQQIQKEASRYRSFMIHPGIQAGQPTAVLHYSF